MRCLFKRRLPVQADEKTKIIDSAILKKRPPGRAAVDRDAGVQIPRITVANWK